MPVLTCLVLDRHPLVGKALGGLLADHCGLELVGVFSSVAKAVIFIENSAPDLLLLDVHCSGEQGETWVDAALALGHANAAGRLILITDLDEVLTPPEEVEPLVVGIINQRDDWDDLVRMVTRLQEQSPRRALMSNPKWRLQMNSLTPRELRVFHALGLGLLNKEIANLLGLSLQTVETYRKQISAKLSLSGSEMIRAATLYRCTNPMATQAVEQPH